MANAVHHFNTKAPNWTPEEDARFCDLIADGWPIGRAALRVGKSRSAGTSRFARIRQAFGWQAE